MKNDKWLFEISPKSKLLEFNLKEVWRYRDLLMLFVKRDVITLYKQTILGPLWYLIQPLFTSVIFTLIFNNIAGIKTGEVPPFLFNLAGVTTWNYFKECLTATSDTFKKNEQIFGKVYFPRIIMPMSIVISNLLKFAIQFGIFIAFYIYYYANGSSVSPNSYAFLYPFVILLMGILGLGLGMIISSMVTKYRDLSFLVSFGVQLLMYLSAVMYPVSEAKEKFQEIGISWVIDYNPLAQLIELSRYMLINEGQVDTANITITATISLVVLIIVPEEYLSSEFYESISLGKGNDSRFYYFFHRTVDIIISIIGLVLLAVFLPIIFVLNLFGNRGPMFYTQSRVGEKGRVFKIYKLRTMVPDAEKDGIKFAVKNDKRITLFGRFLRNTRLDEVPQFLNILKAEMSLIGPRPERPEVVKTLEEKVPLYAIRHVIKPGLTGWAQVCYPYAGTIEEQTEKLRYDLYYIKKQSLYLDFKIFIKTFTTILFFRGQ